MSRHSAALAAAAATALLLAVAIQPGDAAPPSPAPAAPTAPRADVAKPPAAPWPDCARAVSGEGLANVRAVRALEVATWVDADLNATTALLASTLVPTTGERVDARDLTNRTERRLLRCQVEVDAGAASASWELTFLTTRTHRVSLDTKDVLAAIALHGSGVSVRLADVADIEQRSSTWLVRTEGEHGGTFATRQHGTEPSAPSPDPSQEPASRGILARTLGSWVGRDGDERGALSRGT